MTPQEELFSELFNHEKVLVKDMSILELRAHREELAKIAFEARARLSAVDDEEKQRKPKNNEPKGFRASIEGDATTQNLINTVKDRQKRMTAREKLVQQLMNVGYSQKDAEAKLSAGELLGRMKAKVLETAEKAKHEPITEAKPFVNPFAKKE